MCVSGRKRCTGEIAPVGPTPFEFCVPEGVPLTFSPAVGTVSPGQVSSCLSDLSSTLTPHL